MSKTYIDFSKLYESGRLSVELMKELKTVEETLNLTPSAKEKGQWIASPTNVSVMAYTDVTVRKISSMVQQGLSYGSGDYYIFVQFGGKPSVTKSPNGIIKAMNKLASKHGYIANINTGCVFKGYEHFKVVRTGLIDTIELTNSAESEIGVNLSDDILAPYAVVTLYDKKTSKAISSKVTVIRNGEYIAAKKQGSYTHKTYPVPMAEKIALKRAGEQMASSLGIDDSVELEALKREITEHNSEYDLKEEKKEEFSGAMSDGKISKTDVEWVKKSIKDYGINETAFMQWLSKFRCNSIEDIAPSFFVDVKAQIEAKGRK